MPASNPLFSSFTPGTKAQWLSLLSKEAKDVEAFTKLQRHWEELVIDPFYLKEDAQDSNHAAAKAPGWQVREELKLSSNTIAAQLQAAHTGGAAYVVIHTDGRQESLTLPPIPIELSIGILLGPQAAPAQLPPLISLDIDPLTYQAFYPQGGWTWKAQDAEVQRRAATTQRWVLRTDLYQEAGATAVQECAFALGLVQQYSSTYNYLKPGFELRVGIGTNFFLQLAKLRALRQLLKDQGSALVHLAAITASWNKSLTDPTTNLIRVAYEGLAAILGGCDSLAVAQTPAPANLSTSAQARYGKSLQHIYQAEAWLGAMQDPLAGAYFMENLTQSIFLASKALYEGITAQGGFAKYLASGTLVQQVNKAAAAKVQALQAGKMPVVGVTHHPPVEKAAAEVKPWRPAPERLSLITAVEATLG